MGMRLLRLVIDIGLAPASYFTLLSLGAPTMPSLLTATAVATVLALVHVVATRRIDGVTALSLGSYVASVALSFVAHDPRFLLLRDPLTSGLAGVVFLVSCFTAFPAMSAVSRRMHAKDDAEATRWNERLKEVPGVRSVFVLSTAVWAAGLLVESAARAAVIYVAPVREAGVASPVIELSVLALVFCWTVWYRRRTRVLTRMTAPAY